MQRSTSSRSTLLLTAGVCSALVLGCSASGTTTVTTGTGGKSGGSGGSGNPGSGGSGNPGSGGSGNPGSGGSGNPGSGGSGNPGSGGNGNPGSGGNGNPGSGGSANPGTGGNANPGTGGGSAGGGSANRACAPASVDVISDFEEGSGVMVKQGTPQRTGWWYTFKDATLTGAMLTPPMNPTGAVAVEASGDTAMCNKWAFHSTASGIAVGGKTTYGGFGATFLPDPPPAATKKPYSVAGYEGITFKIKSGGGTQPPILFEVHTTKTTPPVRGGTAMYTHVDADIPRSFLLTNLTTAWQTVYIPFAMLWPFSIPDPAGCNMDGSGILCQAPTFDAANVLGIQFEIKPDYALPSGVAPGSFNIWVDDVALYKGDMGVTPRPGFPNDAAVGTCSKPTNAAGKYLLRAYDNWKNTFVKGATVIRPENGGDTVSEGIAYGLLIAVAMNDQPLFDQFYIYWKSHAAVGRLMTWCIPAGGGSCSSTGGSATDADEDAAFALLQAAKKWGGSYMGEAVAIIGDIWANDIDAGQWVKGGNQFSQPGTGLTNPSYFAPAYYRIFAKVDTAHNWTAVANNVYTALGAISPASDANGLVSAWCTNNCSTRGGGGYPQADIYQYDSHRTPWRIGLDYCWNGTAAAKTYVGKTSKFFSTASATGISRIFDLYNAGGLEQSGSAPNSMSIIGTAAVGAMSDPAYKTFLDASYQLLLDQSNRGTLAPVNTAGKTPYSYFNGTVGLLMLLTMTGNFAPPM